MAAQQRRRFAHHKSLANYDRPFREGNAATIEDLGQLVQTWNDLDGELLSRQIATLPLLLRACIEASGVEINDTQFSL